MNNGFDWCGIQYIFSIIPSVKFSDLTSMGCLGEVPTILPFRKFLDDFNLVLCTSKLLFYSKEDSRFQPNLISLFITSTQSHWEKQHCLNNWYKGSLRGFKYSQLMPLNRMARTVGKNSSYSNVKNSINRSQILLTSCHLIVIVINSRGLGSDKFVIFFQTPGFLPSCSVFSNGLQIHQSATNCR